MLTADERRRLVQLTERHSSDRLSPAERNELQNLQRRASGSQQQQSSSDLTGEKSQRSPDGSQQQQQQDSPFGSSQGDAGHMGIVAREGNVPDGSSILARDGHMPD